MQICGQTDGRSQPSDGQPRCCGHRTATLTNSHQHSRAARSMLQPSPPSQESVCAIRQQRRVESGQADGRRVRARLTPGTVGQTAVTQAGPAEMEACSDKQARRSQVRTAKTDARSPWRRWTMVEATADRWITKHSKKTENLEIATRTSSDHASCIRSMIVHILIYPLPLRYLCRHLCFFFHLRGRCG